MNKKNRFFTNPITFLSSYSHSLRWRLLILLGVIFLITLLIIGAGVYYFILQNEQRTWQGRQQEAAASAGDIVSTFVKRAEDTLGLTGSFHRNDLIANPQVSAQLLEQNSALLELVRVDGQGILPGSYQDAPILANSFTIAQSNWFIQAQAGRLYLGEVQISADSEPYLVMAGPALHGGVVAARLRMNILWELVADLNFGQTGQAYVVNPAGQIIAHTDPAIALAHTSLVGRPEMAALLQAPDWKWSGAYRNFQGSRVIGVTAPVPGTDWVIITEVAESEAFESSRTALQLLIVGLTLVGLLVMLVTTRFLNNLVLQPMEQLQVGALRIEQGDLTHKIKIGREQDEVGRVATAFNDMIRSLRERDARIVEQTKALQESEARFRQVASSISDHIYMSEITQEEVYINRFISPNVKELTGYPWEKFWADWSFWPSEVIHPDDQAAAATQAERLAQGQNSEAEYRMIRADGNIIWVRDSGQVRKDAPGQSLYIFGVVSDITERKQAEQIRQQQQAFLQQVIDINPHFIFAKDRQMRFTLANRAFAKAYGITVEELIGKTDADFNPNKDMVARYTRDDLKVIETGEDLIIPEDEIVNIHGQRLWRYTIKRPILDEEGRVVQVLGIATDITYLKEAERELAITRDQALAASRLKSELLARVSHELRTPLGAILGFAEILKLGILGNISNEQSGILQNIMNSTDNLTGIVNKLLDEGRLEAGNLEVADISFAPQDLIEQMQLTMNVLAENKGLQLAVDVAADVPETLSGDPDRLQQVLNNLVGNAIKFTEQGSVQVRIYRPTDMHWAIEVSDTGPGIPQQAQSYIFDAFRQVDGSVTRKYGGSGLGLSIVKQLTMLMKGQIMLKSEVGQGATFTVMLPLTPIQEGLS